MGSSKVEPLFFFLRLMLLLGAEEKARTGSRLVADAVPLDRERQIVLATMIFEAIVANVVFAILGD